MGSSQHFDGKHFQFRIIRTKMVCIEKQIDEIKKKSQTQFRGVVTLNFESRSRIKGLQPQPQTCAVKKDQMPSTSCLVLAGISLLHSAFPIYFSYSWATIYDDEMLTGNDNWTKYKVCACLSALQFEAVCLANKEPERLSLVTITVRAQISSI